MTGRSESEGTMTTAKFKLHDGSIVEGIAECSVDGAKLTTCFLLDRCIGWFSDTARTRVDKAMMVPLKLDGQRDAIALHHGAKWATFEFCPFCGKPLRTSFGVTTAPPTPPKRPRPATKAQSAPRSGR